MILRLVFVAFLVVVFVVPVYRLLIRRTTRVKSELEDDGDIDQQLTSIQQKKRKLKQDCKEEERSANKRAKRARNVQTQLNKEK